MHCIIFFTLWVTQLKKFKFLLKFTESPKTKHFEQNNTILCYLTSTSDRSPAQDCAHQAVCSLPTFTTVGDAETTSASAHTDQSKLCTAGLSANQQWPEKDAISPHDVLISNPDHFQKTPNQDNLSPTSHLRLVAIPLSYSGSSDTFHQMHPTHLPNMNFSFAPVLVPLTYNGQTLNQMASSHAHHYNFPDSHKLNDTSVDAAFLPANTPQTFYGPSPACSHTLPVFSVIPAQTVGVQSSCGSSSVPVQNQAKASDDTTMSQPSFQMPTTDR